MANKLITRNIWSALIKVANLKKTKSMVAVAYFGQQGSSILLLKKGTTLLLDDTQNY